VGEVEIERETEGEMGTGRSSRLLAWLRRRWCSTQFFFTSQCGWADGLGWADFRLGPSGLGTNSNFLREIRLSPRGPVIQEGSDVDIRAGGGRPQPLSS
jgi:hypothetical protein